MQWILQEFDDTRDLAYALNRIGLAYSWHRVVPFVGALEPEPVVPDPDHVILFGSYALWRMAEARGYRPGMIRLAPYVGQAVWQAHMLNGPDALVLTVAELADHGLDDAGIWFARPVEDSKAISGGVRSFGTLREMARKVLTVPEAEIPPGSLSAGTELMLTPPQRILKEWRVWIVAGEVVTYSLYKEGARVTYRAEIDADALDFAKALTMANPGYAPAYVMDICRCEDGLRLLETNCLNAAGFYAADLPRLVLALEDAFG